jgi:hypothetical protein
VAEPAKVPLVPSITGSPQIDTFLGYLATHVGAIAAAVAIAWMDAHGFDTKALAKTGLDLNILIATTVGGFILSIAAWVWGQYRTKWAQGAIVNNTVRAALTGEVPAAIMAKATESQARAIEENPATTVVATPPAPAVPAP